MSLQPPVRKKVKLPTIIMEGVFVCSNQKKSYPIPTVHLVNQE